MSRPRVDEQGSRSGGRRWFVFALALGLAVPGGPAGARSWEHSPRALVVLRDDAPGGARSFADRLEAAGGHVAVVTSSRTAVVYADDAILAGETLRPWVASVHRGATEPAGAAAGDGGAARAVAMWNMALEMPAASPADDGPGPAEADAGKLPVRLPAHPALQRAAQSGAWPYGADYYDTSEFMAGSVAVGVWLLEAAGPGYDWSADEVTQTLAGVQSGLENWVRKGGAPAFLTFYLDIHTGVPVSGVPISNAMSMDQTWVNEALGNAGWPGGNGFEKAFAYNNAIRDTFETNWCYSIVIVDSNPNVNQGLFSGGGYAWSYYGGPWVYMSRYSTWAYNAASYYAVVPMHESGHTFMSTDEYDGVIQYGGYLNLPDQNVRCIMNRNDSTTVCSWTRGQLGWRDLDGDGVIDPLSTPPLANLSAHAPDPTAEPTPAWSGAASVTTLPNLNPLSNYYPPHAQTIARIDAVECRVDGGEWSAASADDGAFDGYAEAFSWTAPPLMDGEHVVEARAHTSAGVWSAAYGADTLTVSGSPVGVPEQPVAGSAAIEVFSPRPNPARGACDVRFALARGGVVSAGIFDAGGRLVRRLADAREFGAGAHSLHWDGRDDEGRPVPPGVLLVQVVAGPSRATRRFVVVR